MWQADALDNHGSSQSAEAGLTLKFRGKRFAPLGPGGEVVYRRLLITGYHRANFAFYVTPLLNGREERALRTYVSRPGPAEGTETRFSILVALYRDSTQWSVRTGLVGSTIDALIEVVAPSARFDIEGVDFLHEQIDTSRNRTVSE
jgi:hypothetical protein